MTRPNGYPLDEVRERYRFLAKLGSGGMADVYLGIQLGAEDFRRLVVIKRIRGSRLDDADSLRMLIDEGRLVASLSHPHIVKIFDLSRMGDDLCIAMEYVDGESLAYIQQVAFNDGAVVPVPVVCKLMVEACDALHYAHSAKAADGTPLRIIHRDIGPQNLLIDCNGYLKIIDFGIAKSAAQSELTSPGMFKGKLPYIAPDVFSHTDVDGRLDLYALGLVFYEMLTLHVAFPFKWNVSVAEVMRQKTAGPLPPPSSKMAGLDSAFDTVLAKATHPLREKRYQSGEELAEAVRSVARRIGGLASSGEVAEWFHKRFAERIGQRREFERLAMVKAAEQTDIPPPMQSGESKQSLVTSRTVDFDRIGIIDDGLIGSTTSGFFLRRANPYMIAVVAFALFLGGALIIRQLFTGGGSSDLDSGSVHMILDNLFVQSSPPGAEIFINDKKVGTTGSAGLNLRVEPNREYTLVLRLKGYNDYSIRFVGEPFAQRQILATLLRSGQERSEIARASSSRRRTKFRRRRSRARKRVSTTPDDAETQSEETLDGGSEEVDLASRSGAVDSLLESDPSLQANRAQGEADRTDITLSAKTDERSPPPALPPPPPMVPEPSPAPADHAPPENVANKPSKVSGPIGQDTTAIIRRRIAGSPPQYPRFARMMGVESSVAVKIIIDKSGKVSSYDFVSGDSMFHVSVKKALKTWRFSPLFVEGKSVETTGTLKFMFKLKESDTW